MRVSPFSHALPILSSALHYLQSTAELPSLIILDLMMPVMAGWALRDDAMLATSPIVITTAHRDFTDQAAQLGVAGYLTKPFERDAIQAIVQRYGRAEAGHKERANDQ